MKGVKINSGPHRISAAFSVRFTLSDGRLNCEWSPRMPSQREQQQLMLKYQKARDEFLAGVSAQLGASIVVAEFQP